MPKAPPLSASYQSKIVAQGCAYLALDPGTQGGIAWLFDGQMQAYPMPETELEVAELIRLASSIAPTKALIEKVSASSQMGVTSAFTFGRGYGFLRACLISQLIPFEEIRPQEWQKYFGMSKRKDEEQPKYKKRLKAKAQQIEPSFYLWKEPKTEGKQLAVADAILLAHFARHRYEGRA